MKKIDTKLMHPAEQIALIIGRIYRRKMTTTSGGMHEFGIDLFHSLSAFASR